MPNVSVVTTALALVPALAVPAAAAPPADTLPETGSYGLRFALPTGGGGSLGGAFFVSDRTSLGLDVSFSFRSDALDFSSERDPTGQEREETSWHVGVEPEVRRYLAADRPVVPFLRAAALLRYGAATRDENRRADVWTSSARTGVGAEWFPTAGVGISGSTGIRVRRRTVEREQDEPQAQSRNSAWDVGVFRSELLLSLYF